MAAKATNAEEDAKLRPSSHQRLAAAILGELSRRDPAGTRLGDTTDLEQAAVLAVDILLNPATAWVEHLGAFYDTDAVRQLLARVGEPVSRQAVNKRKGLLALTTGSGRVVYPALQFRHRTPAPGLSRVLEELPEDRVSRWTVASWLNSPEADLDGQRPIEVLFDADPAGLEAVLRVAHTWAAQLAP